MVVCSVCQVVAEQPTGALQRVTYHIVQRAGGIGCSTSNAARTAARRRKTRNRNRRK